MFTPSKSTLPVFVVLLVACSAASEPTAPLIATSATLNNGEGVVVQAMGAGVVNFNPAGDVGDGKFQFVAIKRADGTVTGHFRQSRVRGTALVEFEGVVTCVTIDPNFPGRARIGGVVTVNNSTDPLFLTANHEVGDGIWFRVEDNGKGDQKSTSHGFKPTLVNTSAEYCALPFDGLPWWNPATIFPLEQGTIRVNP